jgi:deoxyribonuclease-1-like protein
MSTTRYHRRSSNSSASSSRMLPLIGTIVMGLLGYAGCQPDGSMPYDPGLYSSNDSFVEPVPTGKTRYVSANTSYPALPIKAHETVLIASFNIQALGESKMNDRWVMERLAEIIRRFDIVAIQEIRSKDQQLIPNLLNYVNARGARYDFLIGPRLGDTSSKEQYAYVFDTTKVVTNQQCSYTLNDDINLLHREPLVARFAVLTNQTSQPWRFTLVNLHTDPDVAQREVDSMGGILREIRNFEYSSAQEDDVILLGDLNAGPKQMGQMQNLANMRPLIANQMTNVRGTEIYDNILIDPTVTGEFTGNCGVLNIQDFFNIQTQDALKLSDHQPIWAEFLIEERATYAQPQMARQPIGFLR